MKPLVYLFLGVPGSGRREILSDLLGAIQDQFAEAGVEILSPAYHAMRNGNPSTVPPWPPRPGA